MAHKRINIPLINQHVRLFYGDGGFDGYIKDTDSEDDRERLAGSLGMVCGNSMYLKELKDINTIVHEVSHVSYEIMNHIGVDDEEFRAYIAGHIAEKIFKFANDQ